MNGVVVNKYKFWVIFLTVLYTILVILSSFSSFRNAKKNCKLRSPPSIQSPRKMHQKASAGGSVYHELGCTGRGLLWKSFWVAVECGAKNTSL
jgi:hypothetical protein